MFGGFGFGGGYFGDLVSSGRPLTAVPEIALMVIEAELMGFGAGWTAIYEDLAEPTVDITRGFQSDQPDDLVAAPAACSFTLRNGADTTGGVIGYYSPDNASCRPGWAEAIRVRVRLRVGVTLRTRFIGFVQSIHEILGIYNDRTVVVTAASWVALAATTLASGLTAQANQRGDQLATTLQALAAFPPPATSFTAGVDTYPYALDDLDPTQATIVDGFDSVTKSGLDRIWEAADGTLVYEPRSLRRSNPASLFVVTDVAPVAQPGFALAGGSLTRELASRFNRVTLTGHPRAVDASPVVLFSYPISASNPSVAAGATVTIRGPYVDPSQLAQQVGGFNMLVSNGGGAVIGTAGSLPTADFKFTTAPAGGGSDVSSQFVVTVVYEARQATFTITNNSGAIAYYAELQCRGQGIYDYVQAIGSATNPVSIGQSGTQTLSIDCPYQTDQTFLQTVAAYIVEVYGLGISRFDQGIPFFVHAGDVATLDQLLAREISDPVGVTETVSGIAAGPYWINSVHEQYDERCNLTLAWTITRRFSAPVTQAFSTPQTATPFIVPSNVTSITVKAWGAAGGADGGDGVTPGGGAGFVQGTIVVTPGETLLLYIGGGGARSARSWQGGGGGGFTAIYRGGTPLLVAAGGGGGARDGAGGPGGGTTGTDGIGGAHAGKGGTPSAAGAAGTSGGDVAATPGSGFQGGTGGGWSTGTD